jgi:spermidine synthase
MIEVAKNEFQIERFKNIHIIEADALLYIKNSTKQFDLIIIDIFINNVTPEIFTQDDFTS